MIGTAEDLLVAVAETVRAGARYRIAGGEPWRVVPVRGSTYPWHQSPVVAVYYHFWRDPQPYSGESWCARRIGLPETELERLRTDQVLRLKLRRACGTL